MAQHNSTPQSVLDAPVSEPPQRGPVMTLAILGMSHDHAALWFAIDGDETYVTPDELATHRKRVAVLGHARHDHFWLDESDVTELIRQFNMAQPLYPLEPCRTCGMDAVARIQGDFYCSGHELGFRIREEEGTR